MLLGCVRYQGVSSLFHVDDIVNFHKYIDSLKCNLWPAVAKYHFTNSSWIFQDDNLTPHRSCLTKSWKEKNNTATMIWLVQLPDMNIVENI